MPDTLRLFIAIDLPKEHKAQLSNARREIDGIRWSPPEQYHLTLRFLGDVEADLVPVLAKGLQQLKTAPFTLHLGRINAFPSLRRPRVIHIATRQSTPLLALNREVNTIVDAAGIQPDPKPFSPHVTLARVKDERRSFPTAFFDQFSDLSLPPFLVDEVRLYKSILRRSGAVHECLHVFPLHA